MIRVISNPAVCSALIAASRPEPGPLTYTSTVFSPCSIAALAAVSAALWAAKGVFFLEPLKPSPPALAQERVLPLVSVSVTMVLLKLERICAWPCSIFFFSLLFLVHFGAIISKPPTSFCRRQSFYWDLSSCGHYSLCSDL